MQCGEKEVQQKQKNHDRVQTDHCESSVAILSIIVGFETSNQDGFTTDHPESCSVEPIIVRPTFTPGVVKFVASVECIRLLVQLVPGY